LSFFSFFTFLSVTAGGGRLILRVVGSYNRISRFKGASKLSSVMFVELGMLAFTSGNSSFSFFFFSFLESIINVFFISNSFFFYSSIIYFLSTFLSAFLSSRTSLALFFYSFLSFFSYSDSFFSPATDTPPKVTEVAFKLTFFGKVRFGNLGITMFYYSRYGLYLIP